MQYPILLKKCPKSAKGPKGNMQKKCFVNLTVIISYYSKIEKIPSVHFLPYELFGMQVFTKLGSLRPSAARYVALHDLLWVRLNAEMYDSRTHFKCNSNSNTTYAHRYFSSPFNIFQKISNGCDLIRSLKLDLSAVCKSLSGLPVEINRATVGRQRREILTERLFSHGSDKVI